MRSRDSIGDNRPWHGSNASSAMSRGLDNHEDSRLHSRLIQAAAQMPLAGCRPQHHAFRRAYAGSRI